MHPEQVLFFVFRADCVGGCDFGDFVSASDL